MKETRKKQYDDSKDWISGAILAAGAITCGIAVVALGIYELCKLITQ